MSEMLFITQEQLEKLVDRIAELEEDLSYSQRLPELEWAEVTSSLIQRFARLSRNGDPEEGKRLMNILDRGSTYVSRLRADRDRAVAELKELKKGN